MSGAFLSDCTRGAAGLSVRLPGAGAAIVVVMNGIFDFSLSGEVVLRDPCADWLSAANPCHVSAVRVSLDPLRVSGHLVTPPPRLWWDVLVVRFVICVFIYVWVTVGGNCLRS